MQLRKCLRLQDWQSTQMIVGATAEIGGVGTVEGGVYSLPCISLLKVLNYDCAYCTRANHEACLLFRTMFLSIPTTNVLPALKQPPLVTREPSVSG